MLLCRHQDMGVKARQLAQGPACLRQGIFCKATGSYVALILVTSITGVGGLLPVDDAWRSPAGGDPLESLVNVCNVAFKPATDDNV